MTADDDFSLLDRWRTGDRSAGNLLFRRHFEPLYRFLSRKVDGELDDLVQDTFVACMHGRDTFRRQSSFRTYLFAIARNMLLSYWRRQSSGRRQIDFEEISIASLSTSVGTRLARTDDFHALLHALRELPVEQQLLLELYYWEDFSRDQLSDVFDVDNATIGSRLFRARQALRVRLEEARQARAIPSDEGLDAWARALALRDKDVLASDPAVDHSPSGNS